MKIIGSSRIFVPFFYKCTGKVELILLIRKWEPCRKTETNFLKNPNICLKKTVLWDIKYEKCIENSKKGRVGILSAVRWCYVYAATPHLCVIKDSNNSASPNLHDVHKLWKRENCTPEKNTFLSKRLFHGNLEIDGRLRFWWK